MRNHISLALLCLIFSSCISVKVPFEASTKAENLYYKAPAPPFSQLDTDIADAAWISEKTGNTISFLSECKNQNEEIEDVAFESVKAIEKLKIHKREKLQINGRNAYEITASGFVDQAKVKTVITTVQTNMCFVSLSYGGLEKHFSPELSYYEKFKSEFKAP